MAFHVFLHGGKAGAVFQADGALVGGGSVVGPEMLDHGGVISGPLVAEFALERLLACRVGEGGRGRGEGERRRDKRGRGGERGGEKEVGEEEGEEERRKDEEEEGEQEKEKEKKGKKRRRCRGRRNKRGKRKGGEKEEERTMEGECFKLLQPRSGNPFSWNPPELGKWPSE